MESTLHSTARKRRPVLWAALAVVLLAVGAAVGLLTTRATPPPNHHQTGHPSTRLVALGDSVPYGHGLANPYLTPQLGLPAHDVSQGPSLEAYPSLLSHHLGLTMTVRPSNCVLDGDQLSISGAVADPTDNTSRDGQCPQPPQQARNLADEVAAADLSSHPARMVLVQAGADDIDFAACLEDELVRVLGLDLDFGDSCVDGHAVTPAIDAKLANVRSSLATTIEELSPHARSVVVFDYYQPIPQPAQIMSGTAHSSAGTNLVCAALKANGGATYAAAQVVLSALNRSIEGAVRDAEADHVTNVRLVDLSRTVDGHGVCTADPWIFSGELVPGTTLAADLAKITAAKACTGTEAVHLSSFCTSLSADALGAITNLKGYEWRVAHPTAAGQDAIASTAERVLARPA